MNREAILVTGVGKRIGLHLAHQFLQQGFRVIGTYRTERPALLEKILSDDSSNGEDETEWEEYYEG